ncbi:MAG: aminotransferase class V-fold PLP-dependent enzyme, partial [Acidobacteriota bacterium]
MTVSLDGRIFRVAQNSEQGAVGGDTVFRFTERNGQVRATYSGGAIRQGSLLGRRTSDGRLELLYQCETAEGELRAGRADVDVVERGRQVGLEMQWRWLTGDRASGTSSYVESADEPSSADLLPWACRAADDYLARVEERPVYPSPESVAALEAFDEPLPEAPSSARQALRLLDDVGSPATVQQVGGRYFGFVNGGVHPPSLAARVLSDAWDQNAAMAIMSPVTEKLERVTERWLVDLLGLPEGTGCGFVSGTATSLVGGIATARDALYRRRGVDTREQGLLGQEPLRVVVGGQAHGAARRALALTGFGSQRVEVVPVDDQGRMDAERLPELDDLTLVLCQAGNVSSGAFDPVGAVCAEAEEAGAWVHVDGAFGLWAGA